MATVIPTVGVRISLNDHIGTVRYVGPVDNTQGIWLGVEWDDPKRGKHDGSKDGKQYFSCRSKTSGSFIRPSQHIQYGVSFLEALSAKYIEALHGSDCQELVTLGSSQGAIQVEAVDLDKVREKFARLDRLREVSLDGAKVVRGNLPGEILKTCPSKGQIVHSLVLFAQFEPDIRGLDLSRNLLPSWESVAQITKELRFLERLSLNFNRLQIPSVHEQLAHSFLRLSEILLNDTLITWTDMQTITSFMPQLLVIEVGYNQLTRLCGDKPPTLGDSSVEVLNLDTNLLSDWAHICTSLSVYKSLQRVVLTCNNIENIPFPDSSSKCLPSIKYLSLSQNLINSWEAVDALSCWLPSLEALMMSGNPLVNDAASGRQSRPLLIARIPSLVTLDGAVISSRERTDSELFYMSTVVQEGILSDDVRRRAHYHWDNLCRKHGKPDEMQKQSKIQNKLSSQLIDIQLHPYTASSKLDGNPGYSVPEAVLRVLPSMTLRVLRLKICKVLKYDARRVNIVLWLRMPHGSPVKLDAADSRDIDWLGVENGSQILYQVQEHVQED